MDKLVIAQHDDMNEQEILAFGPLEIRGGRALRQRRFVLVSRLQEALGIGEPDGIYGPTTDAMLLSRLGLRADATFEERLAALGEQDLGGELQTIIVQNWKTTGDVARELA